MRNIRIVITLLVILIVTICIRIGLTIYDKNNVDTIKNMSDTLRIYKDKNNKLVGEIYAIESYSNEMFKNIAVKDSIINRLQNLVNKNTKSATIIKTELKVDTVFVIDTISKDSIYSLNFDDWIHADLRIKSDSLLMNLKVYEDYELVTEYKGDNINVSVRSNNPFVELKNLKSYQLSTPKRKWIVGLNTGIGLNHKLEPSIYLGVGITYKLFEF